VPTPLSASPASTTTLSESAVALLDGTFPASDTFPGSDVFPGHGNDLSTANDSPSTLTATVI
jgi:hypothetical protein